MPADGRCLLAPPLSLFGCAGPDTPDTRTATFSLAIDATTRANGCLRFVDGSHLEPSIRPHRPVAEDREKAHAIMCQVNERSDDNPAGELVSYVEVNRGDVTVHNERVVARTRTHSHTHTHTHTHSRDSSKQASTSSSESVWECSLLVHEPGPV